MNFKQPGNKKKKFGFSLYWMYAIILIALIGVFYLDENGISKEVNFTEFEKYCTSGGVDKIVVITNKNEAEAFLTDSLASTLFHEKQFEKGSHTAARLVTDIPSADNLQRKIEEWQANGQFKGDVKYEKSRDYSSLLWTFGPVLLLIFFWFFIMNRMSNKDGGGPGGVFNVGKSKAQVFDKDSPVKVTFNDVAGLSEAKTEIEEIV